MPQRIVGRLTARQASNAKPKRGLDATLLADGGCLYLQTTRGEGDHIRRSWLFRYELNGRRREMGLGPLHTRGLAEAREEAKRLRLLLLNGTDPIEARRAQRDLARMNASAQLTFKQAGEKFIAMHESRWRNPKHRQQWKNTLASYAHPTLGSRLVSAIDATLINEALQPIWLSIPDTAVRVKGRIERVVQWVKDGMPLPIVSQSKRIKNHAALPYDELSTFMSELRGRDGLGARALEFLVLTASRTNEVIGARWVEINLKEKIWTIPAERMKAGKEHRVPLSDAALAILTALPRDGGNFVFARQKTPLSNMAMLALMRRMRPDFVPHGFRSTFKDWAAERTNYPNIVSEQALAHAIKDNTEKSYRRGDLLEKRRRLMREWSRFCAKSAATGATITPLRKLASADA